MKPNCYTTFDQATDERSQFPLNAGIYKLRDALRGFEKIEANTEQATRFVNGEGYYGEFSSKELADAWIRNVPVQIAQILGHDVVPAMAALVGDGVPTDAVELLRQRYHPPLANLLDRAQFALTKFDLRREYRKDRQTPLRHLLTDLTAVTSNLLREAEKQSSLVICATTL